MVACAAFDFHFLLPLLPHVQSSGCLLCNCIAAWMLLHGKAAIDLKRAQLPLLTSFDSWPHLTVVKFHSLRCKWELVFKPGETNDWESEASTRRNPTVKAKQTHTETNYGSLLLIFLSLLQVLQEKTATTTLMTVQVTSARMEEHV